MRVVIIQYNAGNVLSVGSALERLGVEVVVSDKIEDILKADKVIFPGVGEASSAMKYLREKNLVQVIPQLKQHFLGICLGMQLMCKFSSEGNTHCLGIFEEEVRMFRNEGKGVRYKIPHVGWNNLTGLRGKLFNNLAEQVEVYFLHSYYVGQSNACIAEAEYILKFSAALEKNNFYAVQFHPEKSGIAGEQILRNFIALS